VSEWLTSYGVFIVLFAMAIAIAFVDGNAEGP
jgi:hypothetical protein